ncbi:MAG TPA: YdcF family protein, partial [Polyangiaceae bacterium]
QLDALVVLGCRVTEAPLSGAALRRVERAARAFREGVAPSIVVSGGRRWHGVVEADALAAALVERGVPRAALVLERESATTHENALFTARAVSDERRRVGVVTCDWHLRRALYCFQRAGFDAVGLGAPSPPVTWGRKLLRTLREHGAWLHDRAVARGW